MSKTDALFSTQYSDPVDLLSQHLVRRLERLQEQVEFARDNPGPKADLVVEVVREADFVKLSNRAKILMMTSDDDIVVAFACPLNKRTHNTVCREEMRNNLVFAKNAFAIQAGQETVDSLVEKKLIQNVY